MTKTLRGKVRGKTIELDEDLGVVDGQEVEVRGTVIKTKKKLPGLSGQMADWEHGDRRRHDGGSMASGRGFRRARLCRCRMRWPPHKQVAIADERS